MTALPNLNRLQCYHVRGPAEIYCQNEFCSVCLAMNFTPKEFVKISRNYLWTKTSADGETCRVDLFSLLPENR
jgi:hypothetical protein